MIILTFSGQFFVIEYDQLSRIAWGDPGGYYGYSSVRRGLKEAQAFTKEAFIMADGRSALCRVSVSLMAIAALALTPQSGDNAFAADKKVLGEVFTNTG